MRIVCQIGYAKANNHKRIGQKVTTFVNDIECGWGDKSGKFITSFLDTKKGRLWYLWDGELEDGDIIHVQVLTTVAGSGPDERKTFDALYVVDASASIKEIEVPGVGQRGYPLIKGRVLETGTVSKQDEREAEIMSFLDDEGF